MSLLTSSWGAMQEVFPGCCIHFEDWKGVEAVRYLARYRNKVLCYNDDIQGTAGVTLAGLINGLKITGGQLKDQGILFAGAGSAAIGLADLIVSAMGNPVEKHECLPEDAYAWSRGKTVYAAGVQKVALGENEDVTIISETEH